MGGSLSRCSGWQEADADAEGDAVEKILSGCEPFQHNGLLRATPASMVLHGFGSLLASSTGSERTYDLSTPVDGFISCFLSHNWSVHRITKFLVWAVHFNRGKAFLAAMAVAVLGAALTYLQVLPLARTPWGSIGVICWAATYPTFMLVLLIGHELEYLFGIRGPEVFLDKTCIHQTNQSLKKQGISKLGAFILHSSDMLVCYSDVYLRRLWTVYELGCYLVLHRSKSAIIMHANTPYFIIILVTSCYVITGISRYAGFERFLAAPLICFFMSCVSRMAIVRLVGETQRMTEAVESFELGRAECFDERDREFVKNNIVVFMKSSALAPEDASDDEVVTAFDDLVRTRVPDFLVQSMGPVGVKWSTFVMVLGLTDLPHHLDIWVSRIDERNFRANALELSQFILSSAAVLPLWLAIESFLVRRFMRIGGILSYTLLVATLPLNTCLGLAMLAGTDILKTRGCESNLYVLAWFAVHLCIAASVYTAYRPAGATPQSSLGTAGGLAAMKVSEAGAAGSDGQDRRPAGYTELPSRGAG